MTIGRMQSPTINHIINTWYERRNHVRIPRIGESKAWLDAYFTGQDVTPSVPVINSISISPNPITAGRTATATVSVSGYPRPTLSYQWVLAGGNVSGGTSRTLATKAEDQFQTLEVRVLATNSEGSDLKDSTTGLVISAPIQLAIPADQIPEDPTTQDGSTASLSMTVGGIPYTFMVDDANIPKKEILEDFVTQMDPIKAAGTISDAQVDSLQEDPPDGEVTYRGVVVWEGQGGATSSGTITYTPGNIFAPNAPDLSAISVVDAGNPGVGGGVLTLNPLPAENGAVITRTEYRIDGGGVLVAPGITGGAIVFPGAGQEYLLEVRCVNEVGPGAWSPAYAFTPADVVPGATPAQVESGNWYLGQGGAVDSGDLVIGINGYPNDGGSPITMMQYNHNDGGWVDFDSHPLAQQFIYDGVPGVESSVRVRAVNANGPGTASTYKYRTPTASTPLAPDAYTSTMWSINNVGTVGAGNLAIIINSEPNDNGDEIVANEYTVDGGSVWTPFDSGDVLPGFTAGATIRCQIRAVNGIGEGSASDEKTIVVSQEGTEVPPGEPDNGTGITPEGPDDVEVFLNRGDYSTDNLAKNALQGAWQDACKKTGAFANAVGTRRVKLSDGKWPVFMLGMSGSVSGTAQLVGTSTNGTRLVGIWGYQGTGLPNTRVEFNNMSWIGYDYPQIKQDRNFIQLTNVWHELIWGGGFKMLGFDDGLFDLINDRRLFWRRIQLSNVSGGFSAGQEVQLGQSGGGTSWTRILDYDENTQEIYCDANDNDVTGLSGGKHASKVLDDAFTGASVATSSGTATVAGQNNDHLLDMMDTQQANNFYCKRMEFYGTQGNLWETRWKADDAVIWKGYAYNQGADWVKVNQLWTSGPADSHNQLPKSVSISGTMWNWLSSRDILGSPHADVFQVVDGTKQPKPSRGMLLQIENLFCHPGQYTKFASKPQGILMSSFGTAQLDPASYIRNAFVDGNGNSNTITLRALSNLEITNCIGVSTGFADPVYKNYSNNGSGFYLHGSNQNGKLHDNIVEKINITGTDNYDRSGNVFVSPANYADDVFPNFQRKQCNTIEEALANYTPGPAYANAGCINQDSEFIDKDGNVLNLNAPPGQPAVAPNTPSTMGTGDFSVSNTGSAGGGVIKVLVTNPPNDNGSPITNYKYSLDGGADVSFPDVGEVDISGQTPGATVSVRVKATNANGDGTYSASNSVLVASASSNPPTITGAIGDRVQTQGDAALVLDMDTFFAGATSYNVLQGTNFDLTGSILTLTTANVVSEVFEVEAVNADGDVSQTFSRQVEAVVSGGIEHSLAGQILTDANIDPQSPFETSAFNKTGGVFLVTVSARNDSGSAVLANARCTLGAEGRAEDTGTPIPALLIDNQNRTTLSSFWIANPGGDLTVMFSTDSTTNAGMVVTVWHFSNADAILLSDTAKSNTNPVIGPVESSPATDSVSWLCCSDARVDQNPIFSPAGDPRYEIMPINPPFNSSVRQTSEFYDTDAAQSITISDSGGTRQKCAHLFEVQAA